jgi:hypothetical protein
LVAEGVVFHINPNEVIQSRSREAENAGYLLRVEEIGSLVPVNPHASKVVAKQVVERVPREKAQAIRNPISFVRDIMVIRFRLPSEFTDGFGTPLICSRPHTECNTVKRVLRILLQDKGMVEALRLASASDQFDIVGETSLEGCQYIPVVRSLRNRKSGYILS